MLFILFVRLTIKVKVGIPESFKVGWYPPKKLGRVTLSLEAFSSLVLIGPILNEKQPFKHSKIYYKKYIDVRTVWQSKHLLINLQV